MAVTEDGVLLAQSYQNRGLTHSVTLMPLLDAMLQSAGLTLDDIGLVAVTHGPGSFNGLIVGAMDARRQQVYNALFKAENGRIIRLCDDRAVSCEYVAQELRDAYPSENDILIVGDGAELLYKHLQAFGIPCRMASPLHRYQSAAGAALAAEALAAQGRLCSAQELQPVYLRLSQAERERLAKGLPLTAE